MKIYKRSRWGARPRRGRTPNPIGKDTITFIHHSAGFGMDVDRLSEQIATMQAIQNFHMDDNGWDDIGYNYVIFQPQGKLRRARVFMGRGMHNVPAAQHDHNTGNVAICVVGNFEVEGVKRNTRYIVGKLASTIPGKRLAGHYQASHDTECPGAHMRAQLDQIARNAGKLRFRG